MQTDPAVTITATLSETQAEAFAQFLKRVGLDDYRALAASVDEAYLMHDAGEAIRQALRQAGHAPR